MSEQFYFDLIENYTKDNISELLSNVEDLLEIEPNLIRIPQGKAMVIGDLHGDFETLKKIMERFFIEGFKTLIFLGDYVDRGYKQVEVVNLLFYYKRIFPEKVILLRGNHEDPFINRQYGFFDEIRLKFKENAKKIYLRYNQVFSRLPLAAITWNKIFCVHGGVPEGLQEIEDINGLPIDQEEIRDPITRQLIWNDPKERVKDFKQSVRGPGVKRFGKVAFRDFVERNEIKYVIRSHEKFKEGYKTFFDEKLISIFSSKTYSKRDATVVGVISPEGEVSVLPI